MTNEYNDLWICTDVYTQLMRFRIDHSSGAQFMLRSINIWEFQEPYQSFEQDLTKYCVIPVESKVSAETP